MIITASAAPTSADKATLKSTIATELSVDASTIRDFVVTWTEARRLRRRRLLSSYTWSVSFSIVVSLSALTDDSIGSASEFESVVKSALSSDLESALAAAGLDVTVESVTTVSRSDDDGNDNGGGSSSGASVGVIVGSSVGALFFIVLLMGAYVWHRRRTQKLHPGDAEEGGTISEERGAEKNATKERPLGAKGTHIDFIDIDFQESDEEAEDFFRGAAAADDVTDESSEAGGLDAGATDLLGSIGSVFGVVGFDGASHEGSVVLDDDGGEETTKVEEMAAEQVEKEAKEKAEKEVKTVQVELNSFEIGSAVPPLPPVRGSEAVDGGGGKQKLQAEDAEEGGTIREERGAEKNATKEKEVKTVRIAWRLPD